MKKSIIPAVFGEHTRKATEMTKDALKTTGQPFASYGIQVGEHVNFPDTEDDIVVKEQPVRVGSTAMQRLLLVDRISKDGTRKPSWLSLGVLNRTDAHREPTCAFCAEMNNLDSDYARIIALLGKTITVNETVNKDFQAFDRQTGTRIEGKFDNRPTPVIVYA
jgi:hypothetical protein